MIACADREELKSLRTDLLLHIGHLQEAHAVSARDEFPTESTERMNMSRDRGTEDPEVHAVIESLLNTGRAVSAAGSDSAHDDKEHSGAVVPIDVATLPEGCDTALPESSGAAHGSVGPRAPRVQSRRLREYRSNRPAAPRGPAIRPCSRKREHRVYAEY